MDSSTFIAIITALAILVGAISPIIVAIIQSNKEKQQSDKGILVPNNVVLYRPKTKIRWLVVFPFALLGGIVGYVGAKLASVNPSNESPTDALKLSPIPQSEILPATSTSVENTQNSIGTPLPENMLFVDNFDSGTTAKWVNYLSASSFKDGEIYINDGYLIAGSNKWKNYSIVANFRLISGSIDFGLVSRFQDQDHFYECQNWHNQTWITITGDNLAQVTFDWLARNPYNFKLGETYKARMDVQDETISCYLNNVLVASAYDGTYSTGKFGVRVYDTEVALDNVEVFKIP